MPVNIEPGMRVIAKGKLSVIRRAVDLTTIEVMFVSSGELAIVVLGEIEFLTQSDSVTVASLSNRLAASATLEELEKAAARFNIVEQLKLGSLTIIDAAARLNITKNHMYKLVRMYDGEIGSLSMLSNKRGRKSGSRLLKPDIEKIIIDSIKRIYNTRGVTFSKVWKEVEVQCIEMGLAAPSRQVVTNRIKSILTEYERSKIKLGIDAANQKHQPRPGKITTVRPLAWVEIDHTLVDILILADDRIHLIGRPWLTVVIDVHSRVLLGYYLSLHAPSAVSVACALSHAVLRKDDFVKSLGMQVDDYPFYGVPAVIYMDNAAEFKSVKFQAGCHLFGIDPKYRPIGRKHYGGHVERFIGTMMTSKVHFLKGTTMSNAVARRNLNSEKKATMTFSDFCAWFAREVALYHSTVHSALKSSPRKVWLSYFSPGGGIPYPPQVTDSHQFRLHFMPETTRAIKPNGIEFKGRSYWDPILGPFVGTKKVLIKYDPFSMRQIWVKIEGVFYPINTSDLTLPDLTLEEYRASRFHATTVRAGSLEFPEAISHYREKQSIEDSSELLTKRSRRQQAAAAAYGAAFTLSEDSNKNKMPATKPNYSKTPHKFKSEN